MNELVSVIVPVYNVEAYLVQCLESICSQEYRELQVILIDDGSMDHSGSICDDFAGRDKRVSVEHIENRGVSNARNLGAGKAAGKYIAFVDSDDWLPSNYIARLLDGMQKGEDLAVCPIDGTTCRKEPEFLFEFNKYSSSEFLFLNKNYLIYGPYCKMYKAELMKRYQVKFPIGVSYGEDLIFNFSYLKHCRNIRFIHSTSYFYRIENGESLSRKFRKDIFPNARMLFDIIDDFLGFRNIQDSTLMAFLRHQLFDAGYNGVLQVSHQQFRGNLREKYKYVSDILNDSELEKCYNGTDLKDYSGRIVQWMKEKRVWGLIIWAAAGKVKKV